ncbi:unknown [Eggerthella sp. CAG:1427]|nr:unknown [Eggerthella sp. CAG:1427]
MVAATVDMVTDTHVVREGNLSRLVDITGETGLPAALRTGGLAARTVFL